VSTHVAEVKVSGIQAELFKAISPPQEWK